jgi:hypothetical protein
MPADQRARLSDGKLQGVPRQLLLLLWVLLPFGVEAKPRIIEVPVPILEMVSHARAYLFNAGMDIHHSRWCGELVRDDILCRNASRPVSLSPRQLSQLKGLLRNPTTTDALSPFAPACWNPHFGVELLDRRGKRLAQVSVSLECERIEHPWQRGPALTAKGVQGWKELWDRLALAGGGSSDAPAR